MKRALPIALAVLPLAALLLALTLPAQAQPPYDDNGPPPIPNLNGMWVNRSNGGECEIRQRPDGRAQFINEKGSRAWGRVDPDRVYIPDWEDAYGRPLMGRIRGDRIIWPDGNYWSRY